MRIWLWLLAGSVLVLSLVSFVMVGWDKRRAPKGGSRVPESTLHLMELLGGWPGSLLGRRVFRHKTVKRSYRLAAGACVVGHVAAAAAVTYLVWSR